MSSPARDIRAERTQSHNWHLRRAIDSVRMKSSSSSGSAAWAKFIARVTPVLHRDVALKALPDARSAGPRACPQRFEREARLLASLNHPNIATLHGFETVRCPHKHW